MDSNVLVKQITAAATCQDQIVFVYENKTNEIVVRFVTPLELDGDTVLCHQHLPENGFRRFNLSKIKKFNRVTARGVFEALESKAPVASSAE